MFKKTEVHEINADGFNKLVESTYNTKYNFRKDEYFNNKGTHYFLIHKGLLDSYSIKQLTNFIQAGSYNELAYALLRDMCNKGLVPEGDILIRVS